MGGRGSVSRSTLEKWAAGDIYGAGGGEPSERLFNAPWQRYENGNQVSVGATLEQAESRIRANSFETGIIVDRDGFVTDAFKGGASSVSFGDTPVSHFEGATITHNHPSGVPIFSVADLATPALYSYDGGTLAGIRATTSNNGTFSLRQRGNSPDWMGLAVSWERARTNKSITRRKGQERIDAAARWFETAAPKWGFEFVYERG